MLYEDIAEVADSFWPKIYNTIDETIQVCREMEERNNELWHEELKRQIHVINMLTEVKGYIKRRQKELDSMKDDAEEDM